MSTGRKGFREGAVQALPVVLAAAPFGMLFGVVAVDNGMSVAQAVAFSAMVFAGASQMVGIELFGQKIAPWMIILSVFAVNFRHVLYSAALTPVFRRWTLSQRALGFFLLTDPQFADTEREAEAKGPPAFSWYLGYGSAIYFPWVAEAWVGAMFGRLITDPHALGLDFLLPIYFLGLLMGFRKRPRWLPVVFASGVSALAAFHFIGSPWHVTIGALAGMALAAYLPPVRREDMK